MALSERLRTFWDDLNSGNIDWAFVSERGNEEGEPERKEAIEMLVNREFIFLTPIAMEPSKSYWRVTHATEGRQGFEGIGDKINFLAEKYAIGFKRYLEKKNPKLDYEVK